MGQLVKGKVDITKMEHDQRHQRVAKFANHGRVITRCRECGDRRICVAVKGRPTCRSCREGA